MPYHFYHTSTSTSKQKNKTYHVLFNPKNFIKQKKCINKVTSIKGMERFRLLSIVRFFNSGTLHQCGGTSAINNWLKAQKPHGMQAGKHTSHNISFWYKPNSPKTGNSSSKSRDVSVCFSY